MAHLPGAFPDFATVILETPVETHLSVIGVGEIVTSPAPPAVPDGRFNDMIKRLMDYR